MSDHLTPPEIKLDPEWECEFMGEIMTPMQRSMHIADAVQEINSILEEEYFEIFRYFKASSVFDRIAFAGWVLIPISNRYEGYVYEARMWVGHRRGTFEGTFPEVLAHIQKPVKEIIL